MPRYFAFGSNMSTARLRVRVPAAAALGVASLERHALRFHKRSKDGSGKANAFRTDAAGDIVWGVLFELTDQDLAILDSFEGNQYARVVASVRGTKGASTDAWVYIAKPDAIDEALLPSGPYMRHILDGAREHGLPAEYIAALERVETRG